MWTASARYVPPGEPPELTALWNKAADAMQRAEACRVYIRRELAAQDDAVAEVYRTLAQLHRLGGISHRNDRPNYHYGASTRPKIFLNSRWRKDLPREHHG